MNTRYVQRGAFGRDEDWHGNNAAFICPISTCEQVFVVSGFVDKKGRKCPSCGQSRGFVSGSANVDGFAWIEWPINDAD